MAGQGTKIKKKKKSVLKRAAQSGQRADVNRLFLLLYFGALTCHLKCSFLFLMKFYHQTSISTLPEYSIH